MKPELIQEWMNSMPPIQKGGGHFIPGHANQIGKILHTINDKQPAASPYVKAIVSILITCLAVIILFAIIAFGLYIMARSRIGEIQEKWPEQRCKINIMPIASWVGPPGTNTSQNFTECLDNFLGSYLEKKFEPLFRLFSGIFGVLNGITSSIQQARIMIHSIRSSMMKFAEDIYKKVKDLYYRIAYLVKRIVQIILYIFLTFRNVFYSMLYSYYTLSSVLDYWVFRWSMCFHPDQTIFVETETNWKTKSMKELQIHDRIHLFNPESIIGIWKFWSPSPQSWVSVNDWILTPNHYYWNIQSAMWEPASIEKQISSEQNEMICPWTNHGILQNMSGHWAMDYWGPSSVELELRYFLSSLESAKQNYTLFYQEQTILNACMKKRWSQLSCVYGSNSFLRLIDDSLCPISELKLGTQLHDASFVIGICECDSTDFSFYSVNPGNFILSAGSWYSPSNNHDWYNATYQTNQYKPDSQELCYTIATTSGYFSITNKTDILWLRHGLGWYTETLDQAHDQEIANVLNI